MQDSITEEGRGPQGYEEGIDIVVVGLEFLVANDRDDGQTKQRGQTHQ